MAEEIRCYYCGDGLPDVKLRKDARTPQLMANDGFPRDRLICPQCIDSWYYGIPARDWGNVRYAAKVLAEAAGMRPSEAHRTLVKLAKENRQTVSYALPELPGLYQVEDMPFELFRLEDGVWYRPQNGIEDDRHKVDVPWMTRTYAGKLVRMVPETAIQEVLDETGARDELLRKIREEVDELTRQGHPSGVLVRLLAGGDLPDTVATDRDGYKELQEQARERAFSLWPDPPEGASGPAYYRNDIQRLRRAAFEAGAEFGRKGSGR